jgi:hypothetical protein
MIALVVVILFVFAFLALTHFVYEGIIAPSLRAALRLKLFALRDRLRLLKMQQGEHLSDEVFLDLQSSINFAVARLKQIDLRLLKHLNDVLESDEKLRKRVERRIAMFEACPIEELHQIRRGYFDALDNVVLMNSAGWFPYFVPVFIGFLLKDSIQAVVKKVFSLPDNEIEKIAPPDPILVPI